MRWDLKESPDAQDYSKISLTFEFSVNNMWVTDRRGFVYWITRVLSPSSDSMALRRPQKRRHKANTASDEWLRLLLFTISSRWSLPAALSALHYTTLHHCLHLQIRHHSPRQTRTTDSLDGPETSYSPCTWFSSWEIGKGDPRCNKSWSCRHCSHQ